MRLVLVRAAVLGDLAAALAVGPACADPDGAAVFRTQCASCHSLSPGEPARIGPSLAGVYGRKAGSVPGFRYSYGLAQAGFVWDEAKLDAWLTRPQAVVPTTTMVWRVPDAAARQALIGWLKAQP